MLEPRLVQRLAVHRGRLDVLVYRRDIFGRDGKHLAFTDGQLHFLEDGAADVVNRAPGAHCEQAHGAQHIPRRRFSVVFIPWVAHWSGVVPDLHDVPYPLLRLPRLAGVVVEVGNVEGRLVADCKLPNQARLVGELSREEVLRVAPMLELERADIPSELLLEQGVQLFDQLVLSTHQLRQAGHVVHHLEGRRSTRLNASVKKSRPPGRQDQTAF